MADGARSNSSTPFQGDGPLAAPERAAGGTLTPQEAVRALPEASFTWRRLYTYLFSVVLAAIASACVLKADSPHVQWIGVAAIVAMVALAFLYMDAARAVDLARVAQSALMLRFGMGGGYVGPATDDTQTIGFRLPRITR